MTTIITNNQPRGLLYWEELTKEEQNEFGGVILNDEGVDFVKYKGTAYRLADFVVVPDLSAVHGWDGVISDTFFSGILVKFTEDGEGVIMGRYYE